MSQTSINAEGQPIGVAGQIMDNAEVQDVTSVFSEEASAQMPFGIGVVQGTDEHGVKLPSGSGDHAVGIVTWSMSHAPANSAGTSGDLGSTGLLPKAGFGLMRKGRVMVQLDAGVSSVSANVDRAYLRYETDGGTNTIVGRFGTTSDGHNLDLTKVAVFVSGVKTLADGTKGAILEVDFTSKP